MLSFSGTIDRRSFLIAAGIRIGLFVVAFLGFPILVYGLGSACVASQGGQACQLVGMIVSVALKPLIFVAFLLSMLSLPVRRARGAGLPPMLGLAVPVLLIADSAFLVLAGGSSWVGFTMGVLRLDLPFFAFLAMALVGVLGIMPSRPGRTPLRGFGPFGIAVVALGALVGVFVLVALVQLIPGAGDELRAVLSPIQRLGVGLPYAMMALVLCAVFAVRRSRSSESVAADPNASRARPYPWKSLAIIGIVLTVAVVAMAFPDLFTKAFYLLPLVLISNFVLYFAAVVALYGLVFRRTVLSVVFALVMGLPFVNWGLARSAYEESVQLEASEVAALPRLGGQTLPSVVAPSRGCRRGRRPAVAGACRGRRGASKGAQGARGVPPYWRR